MGNDRTQHEKPDLTSAEGIGGQPSNTDLNEAPVPPPPKPILPKDLPKALGYLEDQELDRLAGAALDELRRRGRSPPGFEPPSNNYRRGGTKRKAASAEGWACSARANPNCFAIIDPGSGERRASGIQGRYHSFKDRPAIRPDPIGGSEGSRSG